MDRNELLSYLNELLKVDEFSDASPNGLQVEGKSEINSIICGVSSSERLFQIAVSKGADMIIVHHGLFWKRDPSPLTITGIRRNRLAFLLQNDLNLVSYHLPLDAHEEFGNNIQILRRLHIAPLQPVEVGYIGICEPPLPLDKLRERIDKELETDSMIFDFGPAEVRKLLVISGSSSFVVEDAARLGVDTFLGGDIREEHVRVCEELGLNFIAGGHYNTEKFGVQALCNHITEKFGVTTEYVDIPNPV